MILPIFLLSATVYADNGTKYLVIPGQSQADIDQKKEARQEEFRQLAMKEKESALSYQELVNATANIK